MAEITVDIVVDDINHLTSTKNFTAHKVVVDDLTHWQEPLPTWEGGDAMDYRLFPTIDRNGTISGTVKVQGVLQNRARVSLYYRKTGALIQSTYTNALGEFEFKCGLNRDKTDYYAVAITEQPFNAQVFDKLTPI